MIRPSNQAPRFTSVRIPPGRLRRWLDGVGFESWLDQGATLNTLSPRDRSNGPVAFNNRSNEYQLNQAYLRLKRDVNPEEDFWDLGGRVDLLYGTDSFYTTARGLERLLTTSRPSGMHSNMVWPCRRFTPKWPSPGETASV